MSDALKHEIEKISLESREFAQKLQLIQQTMKVDEKKQRLAEIAQLEQEENYWNDKELNLKVQKEKSLISLDLDFYTKLQSCFDDFFTLKDLLEENSEEISDADFQELLSLFKNLGKELEVGEKRVLLSEEMDPNNAIISINAGAGGTESCDWAHMLYRMLTRYCEIHRFQVKTLDFQYGDGAGIKSVTFIAQGPYAYGNLKSETGVHRLVRISPFDANSRRHTSFASVFVSPEVDDTIEIEILDKDLKIDVYRSGGAGGQSVNTTDSAVRITHIPTNIIVTCQNERSQLQNKLFAMKILRSRLYELAWKEKMAKQEQLAASKKEIGWGSQIRSYVLHPYKLVKDHRTSCEHSNAEKVLDGEIDDFIKAYLLYLKT